jgi:outer membrane protein TolC
MLAIAVLATALNAAPVLSFAEAMRTAEERNLDLQAAQARLTQANEVSRKVWALYLPQLAVSAGYTRNSVEAKIGLPTGYYIRDVIQPQGPGPYDPSLGPPSMENPPGLPTSHILVPSGFIEANLQPINQLGGQVTLSQALIVPALWPAIQNAYLGEDIARFGVQTARREVLFATAQIYYGAAGLREAALLTEKLLQQAKDHEADAKRRVDVGVAPRIELLRAEVDSKRAEQDLARARNAYEGMKGSLAVMLDREPDFDVERPPTPSPEMAKVPELSQVLELRPDVQMARSSLELAKGLRTGTWFKYAPSVGLNAAYRASNTQGFTGTFDSWLVTVGLNWVLWDGGLRESELRENAAKIVEANAQLRLAEAKAKDDVRRSKLDLETALGNEKKARETLALARESSQLAQTAYAAGGATYLQVADALTILAGAELAALSESLNAQLAVLRLAKAGGTYP